MIVSKNDCVMLLDMVIDHFHKQDLLSECPEAKDFHPHLTVMKLSKAPQLRKHG